MEHTRLQSYKRYKSMTSANNGNYEGQHPCDGWVNYLEPTPWIPIICFMISGTQSVEKRYSITHKTKCKFRTENRVSYFPISFLTGVSIIVSIGSRETDAGDHLATFLLFVCCTFYTINNTQLSKVLRGQSRGGAQGDWVGVFHESWWFYSCGMIAGQ